MVDPGVSPTAASTAPSTARNASLGALAALIATFAVAELLRQFPQWAWAGAAISLLVFAVALGLAMNGRVDGLAVDNRNRVSLSKLQMAAWSALVLSALIAAEFVRIWQGKADAGIGIPGNLLAVMGISAASFAATPMVLSIKAAQTNSGQQADATAAKLGDDDGSASPVGNVYARNSPEGAEWMDIFRGDDVSNAADPDLSKVQQFLITLAVLIAYAVQLWWWFQTPGSGGLQAQLPDLSPNIAILVGISHAGYIAYKAAPH